MGMRIKALSLILAFCLISALGIPPKEPGMTTVKKKKTKPRSEPSPQTHSPSQSQPSLPITVEPEIGKEYHPSGTKGGPMVYVPSGNYWMGSSADDALRECQKYRSDCLRDWFISEEPKHMVYLDAFYIDKYEVTQADYRECVSIGSCKQNSNNDGFMGDRQPVVGVGWYDANTYCEWAGKRLPTEAEWEKAARGTDGRNFPWGNEFDSKKANFCDKNCMANWAYKKLDDGYSKTAPVGSYPTGASPYGAMDMSGNAAEWVNDWYDNQYYKISSEQNPKGPASGSVRVVRGSTWLSLPNFLRSSTRYSLTPDERSSNVGFRCSRNP